LERKTDLQDENSTSPENISGGFKATESHKEEKTVPCVFKWTPKSAAQVVKLHTKHSTVPKKVYGSFGENIVDISSSILDNKTMIL
jgi:hypothetical protein